MLYWTRRSCREKLWIYQPCLCPGASQNTTALRAFKVEHEWKEWFYEAEVLTNLSRKLKVCSFAFLTFAFLKEKTHWLDIPIIMCWIHNAYVQDETLCFVLLFAASYSPWMINLVYFHILFIIAVHYQFQLNYCQLSYVAATTFHLQWLITLILWWKMLLAVSVCGSVYTQF